MAHTEKTIASQTLFEGRIIEVRRDKVELENGRQSTRELVLHHGGVCVAALDEQDRILLVRQFRYPYGKEIIELPAGKIEKGEDPRECGIRELQEECGCTADRFEKLTELYPTPGYCSEIIHLYQASGLHETQQHLDPPSESSCRAVPLPGCDLRPPASVVHRTDPTAPFPCLPRAFVAARLPPRCFCKKAGGSSASPACLLQCFAQFL